MVHIPVRGIQPDKMLLLVVDFPPRIQTSQSEKSTSKVVYKKRSLAEILDSIQT